ncbi:MAG: HD domain-containing protein [Opitutales bacterium]|nr:HD domain-containing protein [Opitutales bacterium]
MKHLPPHQEPHLPSDLHAMFTAIREHGGRPLLAGGWVRDWLRGRESKDYDIEVFGMSYAALAKVLAPFGYSELVGKSFGVIKIRTAEGEFDFALPRREKKAGRGHRGFQIIPDPSLSIERAAARRDFTINAILYDPLQHEILDPYNGLQDLDQGILRHTSAAFSEDPLRVLRGFQFVGRFGVRAEPETIALCHSIAGAYPELARERVWLEWEKLATRARHPREALLFLEATGWLRHFPLLQKMRETEQDPVWHPEGDVFTHTAHALDSLVQQEEWKKAEPIRRRYLFFAVLLHDCGKTITTHRAQKSGREVIVSPGHDKDGIPLARTFLSELRAPHLVFTQVSPLIGAHMIPMHYQGKPSASAVRRLSTRLSPVGIKDLLCVVKADRGGRPPLPEGKHEDLQLILDAADELKVSEKAPRPILQGRHLIERGHQPGPHFGKILNAGMEAQLNGEFSDLDGALQWLANQDLTASEND